MPFISIISTSLIGVDEWARRGAYILIPQKLEFTAYKTLLTGGSRLVTGFTASILRVLIGTGLNLIFTATLAYVIGKRNIPGRIGMTLFIFITMVIGGGLIPTFFLVDRLQLTNSFWSMVIPFLISPWNLLIMRNFFMALPESLEEATKVFESSKFVKAAYWEEIPQHYTNYAKQSIAAYKPIVSDFERRILLLDI